METILKQKCFIVIIIQIHIVFVKYFKENYLHIVILAAH